MSKTLNGDLTAAATIGNDALILALAELSGLSLRVVKRRLRDAHGSTRLKTLFEPGAIPFRGVKVGQALEDEALIARLVTATDARSSRVVLRRLSSAHGNTLVENLFEFKWPAAVHNKQPANNKWRESRYRAPANVRGQRTKVFLSYSRQDSDFLDRLKVHLRPLVRQKLLATWDDTMIKVGTHWRAEISRAIEESRAAVLLVSADFLASDFIANDEIPPLLAKAEREGLRIFPVVVGHCNLHLSSLAHLQAVNPPSSPLSSLGKSERDQVLASLSMAIAETLEDSS